MAINEKIIYSREDLLWEATRRNEKYKRYYAKLGKDIREASVEKIQQFWPASYFVSWKMSGVLDPTVDIFTIKKLICKGVNPIEVHPYWHLFNKIHIPVMEHKIVVPANIKQYKFNEPIMIELNHNDPIVKLIKIAKDRVVISIDPIAKEKDIIKKIQGIIKKIQRIKSKELTIVTNSVKVNNRRYYNPSKIKNYIGWLKDYDRIIEFCKTNYGIKVIKEIDGVSVFESNDFSFKYVIDTNKKNKKNGLLSRICG